MGALFLWFACCSHGKWSGSQNRKGVYYRNIKKNLRILEFPDKKLYNIKQIEKTKTGIKKESWKKGILCDINGKNLLREQRLPL